MRWMLGIVLAGCVALLQACGTIYATAQTKMGEDVMLLGHDPVAYFTEGRPVRGDPAIRVTMPYRTYYFASERNKRLFEINPPRYEPQYGGFCATDAAYALKTGSDPTEFEVRDGRLFIFGDVASHEFWKLDPATNIANADRLWSGAHNHEYRIQTLVRSAVKVPHHQTDEQLMAQWRERNPGKTLPQDKGNPWRDLLTRQPGWRAAEGYGQPALGYPKDAPAR